MPIHRTAKIVGIENALWIAKQAIRHLEYAIRLESYCNRDPKAGSITQFLAEFNLDLSCDLPEGFVGYYTSFTEKELIKHSKMAISIALGVSAQALNNAYEKAGIKLSIPPKNTVGTIRFYINQIRNIFQHSIGEPVWDIHPKKQITIELVINNSKLPIDFKTLHGKEFEYSQIGGLRWWLDAAHSAISDIESFINK